MPLLPDVTVSNITNGFYSLSLDKDTSSDHICSDCGRNGHSSSNVFDKEAWRGAGLQSLWTKCSTDLFKRCYFLRLNTFVPTCCTILLWIKLLIKMTSDLMQGGFSGDLSWQWVKSSWLRTGCWDVKQNFIKHLSCKIMSRLQGCAKLLWLTDEAERWGGQVYAQVDDHIVE